MCSYYTSFLVFLLNYLGKDPSGTIYGSFKDPGQILNIGDCPVHSGTVAAYEGETPLQQTTAKLAPSKPGGLHDPIGQWVERTGQDRCVVESC